jgi:hypothetical protein
MDRRYELEVEGHRLVMGPMTARDVVALLRGQMDAADQIELIVRGCIEHDLPGDLLDAPWDFVEAVGQAWLTAVRESALPPQRGRR